MNPLPHLQSHILLRRLHFHAHHGVAPQETLLGNDFILDLRLRVDISAAMQSDCVEDTVSYADVYHSLKEEMAIPSRLLEHVAGRLVRRLFHDFPQIEAIELRLMKRNPPMNADIESAGVELSATRP